MRSMTPGNLLAGTVIVLLHTWYLAADEARFFRIVGPVPTTITAVAQNGTITWTNIPTNATFTVQTATVPQDQSNWVDWVQILVSSTVSVHRIFDPSPPSGMTLIPSGSFTMGDPLDGSALWLQHTVHISAFYMDRTEVTKMLWDKVRIWADTHGYDLDTVGLGKAPDHPVHSVNLYDCVKWCNARSEQDGLTPVYYTDTAHTTLYRTGQIDLTNACVAWGANGYRLPTEAEWEKAARGGAWGHRFPWSDADTIQHSRANYFSRWSGGAPVFTYDVSPTAFHHPTFDVLIC